MKVRTKLLILLAVLLAVLCAGLLALFVWSYNEFAAVEMAHRTESVRAFEEVMQRTTRPLIVFAHDNSYWDALVDAIVGRDAGWFSRAFSPEYLNSYGVHALWIHDANGELVFSTNNLYSATLATLPLDTDVPGGIFTQERRRHFFERSADGLLEFAAATIHPSRDSARRTEPRGYFFAARLWSNAEIADLALLTRRHLRLVPVTEAPTSDNPTRIVVARTLSSWDGRPVMRLEADTGRPALEALSSFGRRAFVLIIGMSILVLALTAHFLVDWVARPLTAISTSLGREESTEIRSLMDARTEFGRIAGMIHDFFVQKKALLAEMEQRRAAERALEDTETRLRQMDKMESVGRLAGGVAHDFNNLLTGILGYAGLVKRDAPADSPVREYAQEIEKAGEHAGSLTHQLLAFSRQQVLEYHVIDLHELLDRTCNMVRRLISEKIELQVGLCSGELLVKGDDAQLQQVILNLAINARDAMPEGGALIIATTREQFHSFRRDLDLKPGSYAVLTFTDDGCGMDGPTLERIFEPFFTTKEIGHGTGLGLATVFGIAKQGGGSIHVESTPGDGTTFQIFLPLVDGRPPAGESAPQPLPEGPRHARILVAEDDPLVRRLVCTVLEEQGWDVLCVADGREALDRPGAELEGLDLVVSDVVMPRVDGPQLAEALRREHPDLKVLFISGYSEEDLRRLMGIVEGATLLKKPFSQEALARKVREMLAGD